MIDKLQAICENFQINAARQMIRFELESLLTRPEQEPILMDIIHAVSKNNISVKF